MSSVAFSPPRPLRPTQPLRIYTGATTRSPHSLPPPSQLTAAHAHKSRIVKMWFSYVFVAVSVVAFADAYSSGAPEGACKDMIPRHPVSPQKSPAPYIITTSTKVVKAGTPMEVVIAGKGPSNTMRGLLLQARKGDEIVGKFTLKPNDRFAQLMNCGEPGNAITHKKHDEKDDQHTVTYTWTPPAGFNDEIKFRATIAFNGAVFWVGVESAPVKVTA